MNRTIFILLFLIAFDIFSQDSDIDRGKIINSNENINVYDIEWDEIVEIEFKNQVSNNVIYYIGAYYRGKGSFWINLNGTRIEILNTHIRYGPMIKWYGESIAEIFIPTGSPFRYSYFYNFKNNILSPSVDFPIYYDIENDYIIAIRDGGLDLFDFRNIFLLKNFDFDEDISALYFLTFGNYEIKIENGNIYFRIDINTRDININKEYIFKI